MSSPSRPDFLAPDACGHYSLLIEPIWLSLFPRNRNHTCFQCASIDIISLPLPESGFRARFARMRTQMAKFLE